MRTITSINGNEVLDLISANPNGIRLSHLIEKVSDKFGASVTFHTSCHIGIDLDSLLVFLEARNKIQTVRGVVMPTPLSNGMIQSTSQPARLSAAC